MLYKNALLSFLIFVTNIFIIGAGKFKFAAKQESVVFKRYTGFHCSLPAVISLSILPGHIFQTVDRLYLPQAHSHTHRQTAAAVSTVTGAGITYAIVRRRGTPSQFFPLSFLSDYFGPLRLVGYGPCKGVSPHHHTSPTTNENNRYTALHTIQSKYHKGVRYRSMPSP